MSDFRVRVYQLDRYENLRHIDELIDFLYSLKVISRDMRDAAEDSRLNSDLARFIENKKDE